MVRACLRRNAAPRWRFCARPMSQVIKARVSDVEADALRIELEEIQAMRDEGAISRETARNLREEVYLLQMTIGD